MNDNRQRIIVFSGKGGVGKTTVAAATGLQCAARGLKTVVISVDIAHSLSDAFQVDSDLHDHNRGQSRQVAENLWIQEVDIQEELDRHWGEVTKYFAALIGSSGIGGILSEELALIPGMEDVISLLYINQYYKERSFDVIIIDCAPTGESLRFIAMPSTLEWYMAKLFGLERNLMRIARPIAKRITDVPMPEDACYQALQDLFEKLDGVDKVLLNRDVTTVRLVTNAERMVIRETQRAFMYFCLYGLVVDSVIVNRLFPQTLQDGYLKDWVATQQRSIDQIHGIFDPIPVRTVNIMPDEVVGTDRLSEMGRAIYGETDPSDVLHSDSPYSVDENDGEYTMSIKLPFVSKEYVDLFKEEGDLVIRIGSFKRHVFLPRVLHNRKPSKASLESNMLSISFPKPS
ncbi:ArsA family ATPase [Thermodesulfobacteriota bacterium]